MCIVLVFAPQGECKGMLGLPCGQRSRPAQIGPALACLLAAMAGRRSKASQMAAAVVSQCWQTASPKSIEHTYSFLIFHGMEQELNLLVYWRQAALGLVDTF